MRPVLAVRSTLFAACAIATACDTRIDLGEHAGAQSASDADGGPLDPGKADGPDARADDEVSTPGIPSTCEGALGGCAEPTCPTARILVTEGGWAPPQSVLHLSALGSTGDQGLAVTRYRWTVDAPEGSTTRFYPADDVAQPVFVANVAGNYRFHLRVVDELGVPSCGIAEAAVDVRPTVDLHIELLWDTPGDIDQTDTGEIGDRSVGADLDLHLLRPGFGDGPDVDHDGKPDGWFDTLFDRFWFGSLQWGATGSADDPALDRDDTDGAGPENLNMLTPEDGLCYGVGVHYWNAWDYGASDATVRIYLQGTLVFEPQTVRLYEGDFWDVARVCWPLDGNPIIPSGCDDDGVCTPKVMPMYPVPDEVARQRD